MLPFWKQAPFVRIVLPFILGILCYLYFPLIHPSLIVALFIGLGIAWWGYHRWPDFYKLKYAFLKGIFINSILFVAAYLLCLLHQPSLSTKWYHHHEKKYSHALVKMVSEPKPTAKSIGFEIEVIALCDSANYMPTQGKALLYLQQHEHVQTIRQGDVLLIKNTFSDIKKNNNPGGFDYATYCKSKKIVQQAYVTTHDWQHTQKHEEDLNSFFAGVNAYTCSLLKKALPDSSTHGIAEALLVGYRTDIDDELWQAYSNSGIVHIIAISGMHMAMIYGSVRWLLLLIPFFKRRKKIAILIALLFMWGFACITGLPASVTRAAIMFTFIGWADMQSYQTNSINTLAAAAFCMLCYNPLLLQDVGFQLSYMAVLSLIIFYKPIYHLLYIQTKILDVVWKLMAMTIAAQLLTFPLCMYYFHQFPLLFLFTNLIAVPLTTVILYLEIVLVLLHPLIPIMHLLGKVIAAFILFLNTSVLHLSQWSFAVWSEIQLSMLQMFLLLMMVSLISYWLFYKKTTAMLAGFMTLWIFCLTLLYHRYEVYHQQKIVVYDISKQRNVELISQNEYYNPDIDSLRRFTKNETFTLKPAHTYFSVKPMIASWVQHKHVEGIDLFYFQGKKIIRLAHTRFHTTSPLLCDLLILSQQCNIDTGWLSQQIHPQQIVLDSSIPFWKLASLKQTLRNTAIPLHIVGEQGAFIWHL